MTTYVVVDITTTFIRCYHFRPTGLITPSRYKQECPDICIACFKLQVRNVHLSRSRLMSISTVPHLIDTEEGGDCIRQLVIFPCNAAAAVLKGTE